MKYERLTKQDMHSALSHHVKPQIKSWIRSVFENVWDTNKSYMMGSAKSAEKKSFFTNEVKPKLNDIVRSIPENIFNNVTDEENFDANVMESISNDIRLSLESFRIALPICKENVEKTNKIKKITLFILAAVSFLISGFVSSIVSIIPIINTWLPALLASFGLFSLFMLVEHYKNKKSMIGYFIVQNFYHDVAQKQSDNAFTLWKEEFEEYCCNYVENIYYHIVDLIWVLGNLKIKLEKNVSDKNISVLEDLFSSCMDALAEVYYCDQRRDQDPERAVDACIKLIGDLENMEIKAKFIKSNDPFSSELENFFTKIGHIKPGDKVITVYPAWLYKDHLIVKGKLKKQK